MNQLPGEWAEQPISAVADFVRGVTYKKPQSRTEPGAGFMPLLRATNIDGDALHVNRELVFVPAELVKDGQHLRKGDVVLATSSGSSTVVGKSGRLSHDWEGTFGAFCAVLRSKDGISPEYLSYFVQSDAVRRGWSEAAQGTNINNLKRADVERTLVPVPPPEEQERIVEAIEGQFSRLDAGVESLHRAKRNLARLRASILAAAANGELDTSADDLRVDAEHWRPTTLGEVLISIEAGKSFRALTRPAAEDEWGVIKVSAMTWGSFREGENKALPAGMRFDPALEIAEGDLLLSRANTSEYVGATVLVPATRPRLLLSDKSMRLHVREGVNKRWLWYTLLAPPLRSQMSAVATGTSDSMRNISQEKVRRLSIKVPPFDIQDAVVMEVDRRLSVIDALDVVVENALRRSGTLRGSVLRTAFSGDLWEART